MRAQRRRPGSWPRAHDSGRKGDSHRAAPAPERPGRVESCPAPFPDADRGLASHTSPRLSIRAADGGELGVDQHASARTFRDVSARRRARSSGLCLPVHALHSTTDVRCARKLQRFGAAVARLQQFIGQLEKWHSTVCLLSIGIEYTIGLHMPDLGNSRKQARRERGCIVRARRARESGRSSFCLGLRGRLSLACVSCGLSARWPRGFVTSAGLRCERHRRSTRTRPHSGLHARPPGREDPDLTSRAGRRAQAGHGALRRPQGLDGAARRPRPRGSPRAARPGPRTDDGAVHRYEGTVNQVMGDGIMALFGAPLAHEDHAVRACYAALRMQETVRQYAEGLRRAEGPHRPDPGRPELRRSRRPLDRQRPPDGLLRGRPDHPPRRPHGAARHARLILLAPETLQLAEGYVQVQALGPIPVKG